VSEDQIFDDDFEEVCRLLDPSDDTPANSFARLAFAAAPVDRQAEIQRKIGTTRAQLEDARDAVQRVISRLPNETDPEKQSELAVQALTALGTLDANVNDLVATAELHTPADASAIASAFAPSPPAGQTTQPAGVARKFINKVKTALSKINASLLNFLTKYMKFQSWSVSGQLTGGVPWLSGSVTLALTFGS